MSSTAATYRTPERHNWVTVILLVSLAPLAVTLGVLVAVADSVSKVVGHRGTVLRRIKVASKRPSSVKSIEKPEEIVNEARGPKLNILISGASPVGLALARNFTKNGHRVIICAKESIPYLSKARYSRAVADFVSFEDRSLLGRLFSGRQSQHLTYPERMLQIAKAKRANIWIPCDDAVSEEENMQAAGIIKMHCPGCTVYFPGPESLELSWNRGALRTYIDGLDLKIKSLSSSIVRSRGEIHRILGSKPEDNSVTLTGPMTEHGIRDDLVYEHNKRLRDSGYCDSENPSWTEPELENSLERLGSAKSYPLPLATMDKTYDFLTNLIINPVSPWRATQNLRGVQCTVYTLIEKNKMRGFAAYVGKDRIHCPPSENQISRISEQSPSYCLDSNSPLWRTLETFTEVFVKRLPGYVSSALTLQFVFAEKARDAGIEVRPWVIGCSFNTPSTLLAFPDILNEWTSIIARPSFRRSHQVAKAEKIAIPPKLSAGTYSFPEILYSLVLLPVLQLLFLRISPKGVLRNWREFIFRFMYWSEELWAKEDPVVFFWYWLVERPTDALVYLLYVVFKKARLVS